MFKHLLRELEDLSRTKNIAVPIATDELGYIDRECPSRECLYLFKVLEGDWRNPLRDEGVFCPMCGHAAPSDKWFTTEQIEKARENALGYLKARIDSALRRGADDFNRAHRSSGFLKMSMHVSGGQRLALLLPVTAAEVLEQRVTCEACGAHYAVVGAAFFCPCCGHNSVERMFEGSLLKVRSGVANLDTIRGALSAANGVDEAESVCRSILEAGLQHCVAAFQHYAERRYLSIPRIAAPRTNVFQRLDDGDALWRAAVGEGYSQWLSPDDRSRLRVLFERRHLLAHRDGIVDDKYSAKSGDDAYRAGQRIVVTAGDVTELADITQRLADAIRVATDAAASTDKGAP